MSERSVSARAAEDPVAPRRDPSFLIVGTSRSGTTLVQRLANELAGVRIPPETHFFGQFAPDLLRRAHFPLGPDEIVAELERYAAIKSVRGLPLDHDAIVRDLEGECASPWDLFSSIVRVLAGPAQVYGEKTPEHLRWWKVLTHRVPDLRLVCVVREPRAVVASNLQVPFAPKSHVWIAERWRMDQRQVLQAQRRLGPDRCLTLRYEDVVAEPDATLAALSGFLGVPVAASDPAESPPIFMDWEWWKHRTNGPITTQRIDAWREILTPRQAGDITAICRRPMAALGYEDRPSAIVSGVRQLRLKPREQWRRGRFRRRVRRNVAWIDGVAL